MQYFESKEWHMEIQKRDDKGDHLEQQHKKQNIK